MKKTLFATVALATLAVASPALVDGNNQGTDTTTINVNANTPPKCDITASSDSVSLAGYDITNDQGRAKNNVGQKVAQALNTLTVKGWCTGATNSFILSRSALVKTGSDGNQDGGFNTAVIYDIEAAISGATRNSGGGVDEGTSDGSTLGPVIGHFGPTGQGENISFIAEPANSTSSAVANGQPGAEVARTSYTENNARLVAGDYTGTVTIAVTPGL